MVSHAFNPSRGLIRRQRQVDLCEFKDSLAYKGSSRISRAVTQKNPVLGEKCDKYRAK